jgi:UDP-glucose 4-epimerase
MKVLVFGGAGFIGSYVVDELLSRGFDVTVFDQCPARHLHGRGGMILGDILDAAAVDAAVAEHDLVYHFAGAADLDEAVDAPHETISLNVMGTLNILEACRKSPVQRFVYASSAYVFSRKGAFYATSKKCAEVIIEQYADRYSLPFTILRYGSVYGERADQNNRIHKFLHEALTTGRMTFSGDGSEERDYIHGRDAATLSVDILDDAFRDKHVLLAGADRTDMRRLLCLIDEMLGGGLEIDLQNQGMPGHYVRTPYSFTPSRGLKLTSNPSVDLGQGLIECMEAMEGEGNQ